MAYTDIDDPSEYFTITLYTGSSNTAHTVTNSANAGDFKPDWLWIKNRSGTHGTRSHELMDSSRGANKALESDDTEVEFTRSGTNSFNTNGFTVGDDLGVNSSESPSVAWQWKANGGTTTSNTDGSITSTVSANQTAGFSIVSYTGTGSNATIGHGLGAAPKMIIQKNRDESQPWWTYVESIGAGGQLRLNGTNAAGSDGGVLWNSTAPTSSVFSVGNNTGTNGSSDKCIAYCFAEKQGYSKFGSYVGNGNANGTFVYTGLKPSMVMVKTTSEASNWDISTGAISANQIDERLRANLADAEESSGHIDFLSNGFKMRNVNTSQNKSGTSYIYMAFADSPFVSSKGVPTTAR